MRANFKAASSHPAMKKFLRTFGFSCCAGGFAGGAGALVNRWLHVESFAGMATIYFVMSLLGFLLVGSFRKFVLHKKFLPDTQKA
jgi:hypothetical protein